MSCWPSTRDHALAQVHLVTWTRFTLRLHRAVRLALVPTLLSLSVGISPALASSNAVDTNVLLGYFGEAGTHPGGPLGMARTVPRSHFEVTALLWLVD